MYLSSYYVCFPYNHGGTIKLFRRVNTILGLPFPCQTSPQLFSLRHSNGCSTNQQEEIKMGIYSDKREEKWRYERVRVGSEGGKIVWELEPR